MKRTTYLMAGSVALLVGCSTGPAPQTYVLSSPSPIKGQISIESGVRIVELRSIRIPDFLDTTDIVTRRGRNELIVSPTGRWGERLSTGTTHAFAAALTRVLPTVTVATTPSQGRPAAVLLIDIEAFDILADGSCVLAARWIIQGADRRVPSVSANGSVLVPIVGGMTDATIVAAMADAIQKLADHIAISVKRVVEPG